MDYTTIVAAAIGVFLPLVISLVKQSGLNKWLNLLIAAGSSALAGFLVVLAAGKLNWADLGAAVLAVFIAAQAVYAAFWRDSGVDMVVSEKTSFIK